MSELPAGKRPLQAVRRLDHDAIDIRLDASLLDYGRVSKEAGLTSEEAVSRLRRLFDDGTARPARPRWSLPQVPARDDQPGGTVPTCRSLAHERVSLDVR
ncbi:MAG: hypothetical protein OER12_00385 [Acidimicrobiia bacterium]|nr:hypothetical protein [Acidimicrobiia bacterium]